MGAGSHRGARARLALCALISAAGCTNARDASAALEPAALSALELTRGPALWSPPDDGADGAPQFEVRWSASGAIFAMRATASLPWGDAAAVVDADGRLHRFHRDGRDETLAEQVTTPLASADGRWLGYASGDPYGPKDVHVIDDNGRDRVVATNVLAPALLSLDPETHELQLAAAGPGGVMGQHVIDLDADAPSMRCLTNCTLRTGEDWGDAFVPLPGQEEP